MSKRRTSILVVLATLVAAAGFAASTASPVQAATSAANGLMVTIGMKSGNAPAPTCTPPYIYRGKSFVSQGKKYPPGCYTCPEGTKFDASSKGCKAVAPVATPKCETATSTSGQNTVKTTTCPVGVQASASDIDTGNVTILGYIMANGLAKSVVTKLTAEGKCRWVGRGTKIPNFTNSGSRSGYGQYGKFADNRKTFACYTGKGPTGWQKVFDINPVTGRREHYCGNYLWLKLVKGLIQGKVIVVQNTAHVHMHLHAEAHVFVTDKACPGTYAEGHGSADVVLTLNQYMQTHGPATSNVNDTAFGRATANAGGSVVCAPGTTTVVTTTGPTTTVTTPAPPTTTTTQAKSIKIVSYPTENQIPAGHDSGQLYLGVSASDAGGSLTIDPGVGKVSTCGGSPEDHHTFSSLGAGNSSTCFVLYAPDDADKPASMTVTYTATLGSASDPETQVFKITYPTRS